MMTRVSPAVEYYNLCCARETAEFNYAKNPADADTLTELGRAWVNFTDCLRRKEAKELISDAISKLEEALLIDPMKHEAVWWLGKAYNVQGLVTPDLGEAMGSYYKAHGCFQKAVDADPSNKHYRKSLEDTAKAPEKHMRMHTPKVAGQTNEKSSKKKTSDLKSDIFAWSSILAVGIVALVGMAKSHIRPRPPR